MERNKLCDAVAVTRDHAGHGVHFPFRLRRQRRPGSLVTGFLRISGFKLARGRFFVWLLLNTFIFNPSPLSALGAGAVLNHLSQLAALTPDQAAKGLPIQVKATVTYCDNVWRVLFIQEGTNTCYVWRAAPPDDPSWQQFKAGTLVEFTGTTQKGSINNTINASDFKVLGEGPLPAPLVLKSIGDFNKKNDVRWIKLPGVIYRLDGTGDRRLSLMLGTPFGKNVSLWMLTANRATLEKLVGTAVEVQGVLGFKLDATFQPTDENEIWVPDLKWIKQIRAIPVTTIKDLTSDSQAWNTNTPVRLRGSVINQRVGEFVFVQDVTGNVRVNFHDPTTYVLGSPVEVYGYVNGPGHPAEVQAISINPLTAPANAAPASPPPIPSVATSANTNLPELKQIAQVRNLSAKEAARGYPVRVAGVVTYSDSVGSIQFVQDDSAGIFVSVQYKKSPGMPPAGEFVEITGFSGPGDYAPIIQAEHLRDLGQRPFPFAKSAALETLMTGSEDSQWVSLTGIIQAQATNSDYSSLTLSVANTSINLIVPHNGQPPLANCVDALVEVNGVCGSIFDDQRHLEGVRVYVPSPAQIQIKENIKTDPFQLEPLPIKDLLGFRASGSKHRAHTRGSVTLVQPDGSFYLQDDTGGVLIQASKASGKVEVGDHLDLVGFPSVLNKLPVLQEASFVKLKAANGVKPMQLSPAVPLQTTLNGMLVQVEGRLLSHSSSLSEEVLTLQFGNWITDAILEKDQPKDQLAGLVPGSVIRVAGVYAPRLDDNLKVLSFQLVLRSSQDVTLLSRPSWWTPGHVAWVLSTVGLAGILILGWVRVLRKQVRQRTRELQIEIEERKRIEQQVARTHQELLVVSRKAGMAEVAASVLHNVGNVLNSVNVSANLVSKQVKQSKAANVSRVSALLQEQASDLGGFLTQDTKGRQIPGYLEQLGQHLIEEQNSMARELESLTKNVEHINEIVATQQSYTRVMGMAETVSVKVLVEDAIQTDSVSLAKHQVAVTRNYVEPLPEITTDKHKVLQILINLLRNAKHACNDSEQSAKRVTVLVTAENEKIKIEVADNGVGIPAENLTRIFNYGFTTRKTGNGLGLHISALAAMEMGGSLTAKSDGPGKGAAFTLELPLKMKTATPDMA